MVSVGEASPSELKLDEPTFCTVKWLDGENVSNAAPQYLLPSQKIRGVLCEVEFSSLMVRIGDLGEGIVAHTPSSKIHWILVLTYHNSNNNRAMTHRQ